MRAASPGHSLVELLVAIPIIVTALLAAGAGLGFGLREAHRGIARGRIALVLVNRVERLAAEAERGDSTCRALQNGAETVDGIGVSWTVAPRDDAIRSVVIRAQMLLRGVRLTDSLQVRVRCG